MSSRTPRRTLPHTLAPVLVLASIAVAATFALGDPSGKARERWPSLATLMPPGALLTVEARDVLTLVKQPSIDAWLQTASNSPAYLEYAQRTRQYLRTDELVERLQHEAGFLFDAAHLKRLRGVPSALAFYDIADAHFVYIASRPSAVGKVVAIPYLDSLKERCATRRVGEHTVYYASDDRRDAPVGFALLGDKDPLLVISNAAPLLDAAIARADTFYLGASRRAQLATVPADVDAEVRMSAALGADARFRRYWTDRDTLAFHAHGDVTLRYRLQGDGLAETVIESRANASSPSAVPEWISRMRPALAKLPARCVYLRARNASADDSLLAPSALNAMLATCQAYPWPEGATARSAGLGDSWLEAAWVEPMVGSDGGVPMTTLAATIVDSTRVASTTAQLEARELARIRATMGDLAGLAFETRTSGGHAYRVLATPSGEHATLAWATLDGTLWLSADEGALQAVLSATPSAEGSRVTRALDASALAHSSDGLTSVLWVDANASAGLAHGWGAGFTTTPIAPGFAAPLWDAPSYVNPITELVSLTADCAEGRVHTTFYRTER